MARSHTRYCELHKADPAKWAPVLIRDAIADRDGVPPILPPKPEPDKTEVPWESRVKPCRHREAFWRCNGEVTAACKLGLGEAGGIVEEHDCSACHWSLVIGH